GSLTLRDGLLFRHGTRVQNRSADPVFVLVVLEHVPERAAGEVLELLLQDLQRGDALGAEVAEVLAQLAVARDRPALSPEEEPERPDGAGAARSALVDVAETDLPTLAQRGAQTAQLRGDRAGDPHAGGEERGLGKPLAQRGREDRFDLGEHV